MKTNSLPDGGNESKVARPSLFFDVPHEDHEFFARELPFEVQNEVRQLLRCLALIERAKNKQGEIKRLAALMQRDGKKGYSAPSLTRHYYAFREARDWRVLINRAKVGRRQESGVGGQGSSNDFIKFWRGLCGGNVNAAAGAHRELLQVWRKGFDDKGKAHKFIPGYAVWPKAGPTGKHPVGWSYENLLRYAPDEFELRAARIGRAAASELRLKVYTTRVGLRLGEYFEFDDHEYNLKVNFPGQLRAMRPRGFSVIDVLSACCFTQSFKPTLWDAAAEMKRALTERDMMWFVVHVLTSFGYRTDERGTALVVEWGTAAIREEFERRISDATNGKVRVERSGKFGRPAHAGQFEGQSKGNFRFKALVESLFYLVDTYLAALPGQVGRDRLTCPEQLHGAERYNEKLLKAQTVLPADQAQRLAFPVLTWPEFLQFALSAYRKINTTPEHELEGWERLGFVMKEWRLSPDLEWLPEERLLALPESEQQVARAMVWQNPLLSQVRKLSRQEVFTRFQNELTPLPHFALPALMGIENALRSGEPLTVRQGVFEFQDREMGPDTFRFVAADEYGQRLPEGEQYVCFVNPFRPTMLIACDAKLRVKAECKPALVVSRNDQEGVKRAMGAARAWEARALRPLLDAHADQARERASMHRHNAAVMGGQPVTEEEKARARQIAQRVREHGTEALADMVGGQESGGGNQEAEGRGQETRDRISEEDFLSSIL